MSKQKVITDLIFDKILSFLFVVAPMVAIIFVAVLLRRRFRNGVDLFIGVAALWASFLAYFYSYKSDKKSSDTINRLENQRLIAEKALQNFLDIFKQHLVQPLENFAEGTGHVARIWLHISTPAYGYGVIGKYAQKFVQALMSLNQKCELELIFSSPDDHFTYWGNVLLWSYREPIHIKELDSQDGLKSKDEHKYNVAQEFANSLKMIMDALIVKKLESKKVWVVRATTVRIFAYVPINGKNKPRPRNGSAQKAERAVYIVLTDPFSFSLDQGEQNFRARSIPIVSDQYNEFIQINPPKRTQKEHINEPLHSYESDCYFERIKVCPYTGYEGDNAAIPFHRKDKFQSIENLKKKLLADYILGRTQQRHMDPNCFDAEIDVFLKKVDKQDTKEFLLELIQRVINYFWFILGCGKEMFDVGETDRSLRNKPKQALRLIIGIEKYQEIANTLNFDIESKTNQLLEYLKDIKIVYQQQGKEEAEKTIKNIERTTQEWFNVSTTSDSIKRCLYCLFASGLGESEYADYVASVFTEIQESKHKNGKPTDKNNVNTTKSEKKIGRPVKEDVIAKPPDDNNESNS